MKAARLGPGHLFPSRLFATNTNTLVQDGKPVFVARTSTCASELIHLPSLEKTGDDQIVWSSRKTLRRHSTGQQYNRINAKQTVCVLPVSSPRPPRPRLSRSSVLFAIRHTHTRHTASQGPCSVKLGTRNKQCTPESYFSKTTSSNQLE